MKPSNTAKQTPAPQTSERSTVIAVCAALIVAVLALYAQTSSFEFLSLDDFHDLLYQPMVRNGLSWNGAAWAMSTVEPNWHPVTWFSHMLDFTLFGANAGPQHLVNAALHAVTAALLFLALRALSGALWPSALAAALFALHPLRAESVAWVTERKDTLSGLFFMLTMLAYARYARRPSAARYVPVAVAFVLGLASKTMVVSLPVVLLLLDFWPLGRLRLAPHATPDLAKTATTRKPVQHDRSPTPVGRLLLEKLPLVAITLAASALTVFTLQSVGGVRSLDQVSLAWRIVTPPIGYATYLLQSVWPAHLAIIYPHPAMVAGEESTHYLWLAAAATAFLAVTTGLTLRAARQRPYLVVGWLWFLVTLLPVIGIVQVGRQWHADRFTYLPTIGLYIMLAWGLRDAIAARPRLRRPLSAAAVAMVAVLAGLSWQQIGSFRNSRAVFEHAIAVTDDNYFAHQTLGAAMFGDGDLAGAKPHLVEALRISPTSAYAHEQLGLLLEQQGDRDGAAVEYEQALQLSWKSFYARRNLAAIRRAQGRRDDEIALLTDAVRYSPDDHQLQFDLGTALLQQQRYADAAVALRRAVELAPNSPQAHNNLGVALAQQGQLATAAAEFERTLALNPQHGSATKSLEWVRSQQGNR